jgi:hypothetical protein
MVGRSFLSGDFLLGSAHVTARFETVANLETADGFCVTVAGGHGAAPNRIIVEQAEFDALGLQPGVTARVGKHELLTPAVVCELEHVRLEPLALVTPSADAVLQLRRSLQTHGVGAAAAFFRAGGKGDEDRPSPVVPLPDSAVAKRAEGLPRPASAKELIGLGSGYTPSGDDVLAGYLGAYAVFTRGLPEELSGIAERARGRTTALSATTLRFAVDGLLEDALISVLKVLSVNARSEEIDAAVQGFTETVGHSSGSDTLLGVYLALASILAPSRGKMLA